MTTRILAALSAAFLATTALAGAKSYDFKDPKGVNSVQFTLDAPVEAISGSGSGISGTITFDPAAPEQVAGAIVLSADSLRVPNPLMLEHLQSPDWLDVAKHPEIRFEARSGANARPGPSGAITVDVTGTLTLRGVSREFVLPVSFTHLPDKLKARSNGQMEGDLLVVRARLQISRRDFGIQAGNYEEKVSDTIDLALSLAGASPRS